MKVSARLLLDSILFAVHHEKVQQQLNPIDAYNVFTSQGLSSKIEAFDKTQGIYTIKVLFDYATLNNQITDQDVEIIVDWSYPQGFVLKDIKVIHH